MPGLLIFPPVIRVFDSVPCNTALLCLYLAWPAAIERGVAVGLVDSGADITFALVEMVVIGAFSHDLS